MLERQEARLLERHPELRGIRTDSPAQLQERLRRGIRAGRVARSGDVAWVELVGKNPDGSLYGFSELYVLRGGRWLQRLPPTPEDEAQLPADFAPPLETFASYRAHKVAWLLSEQGGPNASRAPSCGARVHGTASGQVR